ncbi:uncharacterized protein METZ01_LOCUS129365 [marine metagenome]|uniref:Uncharacterized protein n=1 Tax=marine metagenome TaxID=408172 RepID=A0A381YIY9_9ZZZZ
MQKKWQMQKQRDLEPRDIRPHTQEELSPEVIELIDEFINLELKTLLDKIAEVPGDIIELGAWTGNNSVQFMWQAPLRKYIGFDTFNGYTKEDIETSPNKKGLLANEGRWNHNEKETVQRLQNFKSAYALGEFEIIKGDLKETLPEYIKEEKVKEVAMLYVDCNAYLPAIRGIEAVYPIMPKGGIICIDEHQVGGETKALLEAADKYELEVIDTGFPFISGPNSNPSKYVIK